MRSKITFFSALACLALNAPEMVAQQSNVRLAKANVVAYSKITNLPNFINLEGQQLKEENFVNWAVYSLNVPSTSTFKPYSVEKDGLGYTHTRHKQYINNIPIEGSMLISHSLGAEVKTVNGDYYQNFSANTSASLSEANALQFALQKVNAKKYMWENTMFTDQKRSAANDNNFSFYPKGELVMVHKKNTDYAADNMRVAFKFNIYAEKPLYRANVFVDANTGEILDEQNEICTIDVLGSAVTMYSGTVPMTSDSTGVAQYRLQETGRGNGIKTYNLQNTTTYTNTDFTNNSSTWNLAGADQAAGDAHWGAEMTYDYYKAVHGRNSIDGAGFALVSYVHYSTGYDNAFWDGQEMTYGDGDGSQFTIMTGLDVCGHEITHGLTNFTAHLGGGEAGALNEGFSDIFGTTIEAFARPTQHDWIMGAEIMPSHAGIRDMSNPKSLGQPDCYLGTNWDVGLEPHQDNGPVIYWYYLLCQGGAGTNDLGNVWNVNAITMTKAQMIAFRGLTVYFTPSTAYADARMYTVQAAKDLYGPCSTELQETTNAWYAVGVGAQYSPSNVVAGFANSGITCAMPINVTFSNSSANGATYSWTFGDGASSTSPSPTHSYTANGVDTVKLVATSCTGSKDSAIKILHIGSAALTSQITEGFETSTLPGPLWNISSTALDWAVTSAVSATGSKSAILDNFSLNTAGDTSILESVSYDVSAYTTPKLFFKMAYRQRLSTNTDKLQMFTSTDCGATWISRFARTGSGLASVTPPDNSAAFFPTSAQFNTYTVNINAVYGQLNVRFRFVFFAGSAGVGNNICIDDINLYDASIGIQNFNENSDLSVYPNPSSGSVTVDLNLIEKQNISINVTDVLGRTIESIPNKQYPAGENKLNIAEKISYQPGVYLVNINADGQIISKKIIIE
jgi:Zn-dependent metalloprotease